MRARRACAASGAIGDGVVREGACGGTLPAGLCIDAIGIESLNELSTSGIRVTTAAKIASMGSPVGPGRSSGIAGVATITVTTSFTPFIKSTTVAGEARASLVNSHPPAWIARKALTREACVAGDIGRPGI
jgi:hypothetical protein